MTERLRRIHTLLREGNVPCALSAGPDRDLVLVAGTPDSAQWEVVLRDANGDLWIHHTGTAVRLPADATDTIAADAVKIRVVQAWAEQGNQDAMAVLAVLKNRTQRYQSTYRGAAPARPGYEPGAVLVTFVDPFQLAAEMFEAVSRLGWSWFDPRRTGYAAFALPARWGLYHGGYSWQ